MLVVSLTLNVETTCSTRTSVDFRTRQYILEERIDRILQQIFFAVSRCKCFKSMNDSRSTCIDVQAESRSQKILAPVCKVTVYTLSILSDPVDTVYRCRLPIISKEEDSLRSLGAQSFIFVFFGVFIAGCSS